MTRDHCAVITIPNNPWLITTIMIVGLINHDTLHHHRRRRGGGWRLWSRLATPSPRSWLQRVLGASVGAVSTAGWAEASGRTATTSATSAMWDCAQNVLIHSTNTELYTIQCVWNGFGFFYGFLPKNNPQKNSSTMRTHFAAVWGLATKLFSTYVHSMQSECSKQPRVFRAISLVGISD